MIRLFIYWYYNCNVDDRRAIRIVLGVWLFIVPILVLLTIV